MTGDVREEIREYLHRHPDATPGEVLGALGLAPEHREAVVSIQGECVTKPDEKDGGDPASNVSNQNSRQTDTHDRVGMTDTVGDGGNSDHRDKSRNRSACHHDKQTIQITDDVGEIVGTDGETYDLTAGETVTLPEPTADVLIEKNAAETADTGTTAAAFMGGGSGTDGGIETQLPSGPTTTSSHGPTATEANYERAVSALPTGQLDALTPEERRRAARKRGLDWPSTDEAQEELFDTLAEVLRHEDDRVIDAPTSLGKSYTVAATRWGARGDLTDDRPVVHLSATRKARDEAAKTAREEGGEHIVLKSRHEACPVAAGDHDPEPDDADEENDSVVITMDGEPASEWLDSMCNTEDGRGVPFSAAHRYLEEHNDQSVDLPCHDDGECSAIEQYTRLREGDHPLVVATHNFAHVPGLRTETNLVIDEEPDYIVDLGTGRVRRAVGAYLREIDAPVTTWESFIQTARSDTYGDDAASVRDALKDALNTEPRREWYFENADAHTLAPALARAIFHAEDRSNGLRHGKTPYQPPRLEAEARELDGWNRTWVSVVLDETNDVRTVRSTPDMSAARSVVGLDAHPALPIWQANSVPWIDDVAVLDPEARRLWRRYERGLRVVQVGDATRPLTSGEYYDDRGVEAITEHLRETYGDEFSTAITAKSVRDRLEETLEYVGIDDPDLMHYGNVKSRNDFAGEGVGFVNGCIDSGDGPIVDLLAELDLDAEPERSDTECETCDGDGCHDCDGTGSKRAHGRGFVGPDAEAAEAILASVRENQVAQAAGRYARDPDDPEETATVFVRTDATPPGFADVQVAGVEWLFKTKQETVVEAIREKAEMVTAYELAQETGVSKRHVHRTLERLVEHGDVQAFEGKGPNGATLYADDGVPNRGVVDLTDEDGQVVTDAVCSPYTWSVTVQDIKRGETGTTDDQPAEPTPSTGLFRYADPPDGVTTGGDPPTDGLE